MNSEMKRMFSKFIFMNTAIACALLFFCGSITVSERTAYNTYLRQYAVLSMKSEGEKVELQGLKENITFTLPEKEEIEKFGRYMKLTPLASAVFFCESVYDTAQKILNNVLT